MKPCHTKMALAKRIFLIGLKPEIIFFLFPIPVLKHGAIKAKRLEILF